MRHKRENLPGVSDPEYPYTRNMEETRETRGTVAPEATEPSEEECELSGMEMFGLHCKLVCPTCGYRRVCSAP